jgi:hypothetical protein|tara:strand:- start:100 stop:522 length:423 start_codon:yes stop_codon:yes gene_type:complete
MEVEEIETMEVEEISLAFNFVYSKNAIIIKKYLGSIEDGECINYIDIVNKLTKNDYYQYEPSDAVVSSYLIKQLQSVLENVNTGKVFYVLSELDELIINNIKEYVEEWSIKKEKEYNIHYTEDISLNGVTELFDGTKVFS